METTSDILDRARQYSRVTRKDRADGFTPIKIDFKRIALTLAQVKKFNPPPNPAKETDARFKEYQRNFGDESWELDALDPNVVTDLIDSNIKKLVDVKRWKAREKIMLKSREELMIQTKTGTKPRKKK